MSRPALPASLLVLCVITLLCGGLGCAGAPLRLLLSQDWLTIAQVAISTPVSAVGIYAVISVFLNNSEAYGRMVLYANVYRGVALLFAVGGLGMLIIGALSDPELAGYGCALLGGGTLSLLWYRVIRYVMMRKDVTEFFGVDPL